MANKKNLIWLMYNDYFDRLAYGEKPNVFIFDTGTIIDIETAYYNNGRAINHSTAYLLSKIERDHHIIFPELVMKEIKTHRESLKNNHFEISSVTAIFINSLYKDNQDFFEGLGYHNLSEQLKDFHRYAVFSAAQEAFKEDYKKGFIDPISRADKESIGLALDISKLNQTEENFGAINILSPDNHLLKTINVIKNEESFKESFQNYSIRAINSRGDIRSYLS